MEANDKKFCEICEKVTKHHIGLGVIECSECKEVTYYN